MTENEKMNLNLLSYLLFFPAMVGIAVYTAQVCHRNGRLWMLRIFDNEVAFVDAVNNVLLVACYVLNAGYIAVVLSQWEPIHTVPQMLGVLSGRIALILFTLAGLHYQNIAVLLIWARIKHRKARMYFEEPIGRKTIFIESVMDHGALRASAPGEYILTFPDGAVNRYVYRGGTLREIHVDRTFLDLLFKRT